MPVSLVGIFGVDKMDDAAVRRQRQQAFARRRARREQAEAMSHRTQARRAAARAMRQRYLMRQAQARASAATSQARVISKKV